MSLKKWITIEEVNQNLSILTSIYDFVRVINPVRKKVINLTNRMSGESEEHCYDLWCRGEICSNCISMRAYKEKEILIKLEYADKKVYVVFAVPIRDGAETVILELIKDSTNSMTVEAPQGIKKDSLLQTLNEISQLQIKDSLTGLFNRRFIDERLPADILKSSIDSKPLTAIFADIDHFKQVNDTYGHVAGDFILKEFAKLLQKGVENINGWVARYGGEEFLICLINESLATSVVTAERIRKEIENSEFNYEGSTIRITSSFGVLCLSKTWNVSAEELVEYADKNLYEAKSAGRNKVVGSEL